MTLLFQDNSDSTIKQKTKHIIKKREKKGTPNKPYHPVSAKLPNPITDSILLKRSQV